MTRAKRAYEPPPRITCGGCSATWTGLSRAHCSGCHLTWSSVSLFDRHHRYVKCQDPAEMIERGESLRLIDGVWFPPEADEEARERFARSR